MSGDVMDKVISEWRRSGNVVYKTIETGWRRGTPIQENAFTIRVDPGVYTNQRMADALAERFQKLLSGETS